MIKTKSILTAMVCAAIAWQPAAAEDFDLASQRGEVQEFNKVPGHKVDHKGLVINPTPVKMQRLDGVLDASAGFKVNDRRKAFGQNLGFITPGGKGAVKLDIDFGASQAKKAGVEAKPGAYRLTIGKKGVQITGYDESGAFYGLQTLRQVLASDAAKGGHLPYLTVEDYPSMKYRGVVEGFYGTPWSHKVRLSLIDFMGANKMNNYIYGPKDDPYHSSPNWRQPYPADQAQKIRELAEACKRNHVDFVWAIHPGKDIRWTKEDYDSLVNKFQMMYDLGVRAFAVFFDDIEGIGTDPARQAQLVNDLTRDFVIPKGDVANIQICPTDYSQLWAKPGPDGPLAVYGRDLNPKAEVFWTGAVVCSDLTPETLEFVDSRIKRPALYWWNYPVTDYCRHILLQGPVYGLDTSLTPEQVIGIESNPMEHGEASKLALYGVADYAWNMGDYNAIDNWERALARMMPEAPEAYRTFAIHSADTETGYRRDESWETEIFPYNKYTQAQFDSLNAEFARVAAAPATIREKASNKALVSELDPWLTEFEKVGKRGLNTLKLIKTFEAGNDSIFWEQYVRNLMTEADKKAYEAHKSGTMKLHPFYENAMVGMMIDFFGKLTGTTPAVYHGVGSYPNLRSTLPRLMLDNDTTTYYTSANSQGEGDWIGVDLGTLRPVEEVIVHQGRNSVDDVDYFDHVILEASADGREWKALTDSLERTYIVAWNGEPVQARYVRLKRLPSAKTNWASVRTFRVNPVNAERLGLNITAADPQAALLAFDFNPATAFTLAEGDLAFDRVKGANKVIVLSGTHPSPLTLVQFDKKGRAVAEQTINGAYSSVEYAPSAVRCVLKGNATVYEIAQK